MSTDAVATEWVTREQAAQILCRAPGILDDRRIKRAVRSKPDDSMRRNRHGSARVWHRGDLEEVLRILRACEISMPDAANVMWAQREGRL